MAEWYVKTKQGAAGPFSASKLKQLAASGKITPQHSVRKGAQGLWVSATKINGLFEDAARAVAQSPVLEVSEKRTMPVKVVAEIPRQHTPLREVGAAREQIETPYSDHDHAQGRAIDSEYVLWEGTSSQWTQFKYYAFCVLFCWLLIPVAFAAWRFLNVKSRRYEVTNQRIKYSYGVLSRHLYEIELYKIRDIVLTESLVERLVKIGTITVYSNEKSLPVVVFWGISEAADLREKLRNSIERQKQARRVLNMHS